MTLTEANQLSATVSASPTYPVRTATICGGVMDGEYNVALHLWDGAIVLAAAPDDTALVVHNV